MQIKSAEFVISNSKVDLCPKSTIPEFAFIGRSNVGKSSLINMLTNIKNLAKTSGKPGKTQLINHFLINKNWHLVDLPGYGYARVSKTEKKKFQKFITDYFFKRKQLSCAFVLVDIRLEPQTIDLEFMEFLGIKGIPFSIIFTKSDKLREDQSESNIENYKNKMLEVWEEMPNYFVTSSLKKNGKEDLLKFIGSVNDEINELSKNN